MTLFIWWAAWLLDCWLGDPQHWPHPVRAIGYLINRLQRAVRAVCHSELALMLGGAAMWIIVVGSAWTLTWGMLTLAYRLHPAVGVVLEIGTIYTLLAGRCLGDAAREVEKPLRAGDLAASREKLSWIVGRDTRQLQPPQITRAVVETVA